MTPFLTALGPAVLALFGVFLGGWLQQRQAERIYRRQRADRIEGENAARDAAEIAAKGEMAFTSLALARHLEAYAQDCAGAISDNSQRHSEFVKRTPDFPKWPAVTWTRLGAVRAAEIGDFSSRVPLVQGFISGAANAAGFGSDRYFMIHSAGAARVGVEAWNLAAQLREDAGLPPFVFANDGWNYAELLRNFHSIQIAQDEDGSLMLEGDGGDTA